MTEKEYCIVQNKAKMTNAYNILRGILPGKEYGIDEFKYRSAMQMLSDIQDELSQMELVNE